MPTWSMPRASKSAIVSSVAEQGDLRQPERPVLRLGIGVLELEDAEAREGLAHARREQPEAAEVRDHAREQDAPEHLRGASPRSQPMALDNGGGDRIVERYTGGRRGVRARVRTASVCKRGSYPARADMKWKTVPSGSSKPRFGPSCRRGTPAARSAATAAPGSGTRSATWCGWRSGSSPSA